MSIHDDPLANYPSLIATLAMQKTIRIVKRHLKAQGLPLWGVTACDIRMMAEAYFESHRAELVRLAIARFVQARTYNPWPNARRDNVRRPPCLRHRSRKWQR